MFELRRRRFYNWLSKCSRKLNALTISKSGEMPKTTEESDVSQQPIDFKWFAMNCRSILYRHRDFEYITYTRYFTLQQPTVQILPIATTSSNTASSSSSSPAPYTNQQ